MLEIVNVASRRRRSRGGNQVPPQIPSKVPVRASVETSTENRPRPASPAIHLVAVAVLMILAVSAYVNTLQNNFVWDDTQQILRNPDVRGETPWSRLFSSGVWAFNHPGGRALNNYFRPLQMLTYRLTAKFFGFSATAFHAVTLVLHLLATLLAYFIVYQLTRRMTLAFAGAVLFALHPIHTEAVAWISASTELGCALFFLLAFFLFLLATQASAEPPAWASS